MYIYHALINALSAHMIHINLNTIFYTHVKHSPTLNLEADSIRSRAESMRKYVKLKTVTEISYHFELDSFFSYDA